MANKNLTEKEVAEKLELELTHMQELKIKKILNKIYSKGYVRDEIVLDSILKIYLSDPTLNSVEDIYIITYGGRVNIEFKYSFWPKRLTETGVFKQVDAYVVREGEDFTVEIDNGKTSIKHTHNPFKTDGKVIGAYARGVKEDGTVVIATANKKELDMAAKAAKMKSNGKATIWDMWFEEVAKKVPLKRLVKLIPIPAEISQAISIESENYASPEEIETSSKDNDAIEAMNELNSEVAVQSYTVGEVLDYFGINYELKQGYVKVKADDLKTNGLEAENMGLIEYKKEPGYLVGKAATSVEIELPKSDVVELVYEPVEK